MRLRAACSLTALIAAGQRRWWKNSDATPQTALFLTPVMTASGTNGREGTSSSLNLEALAAVREAPYAEPPSNGRLQQAEKDQMLAPAAVAVDLISGTAAGAAQIVVGHPFDTVKVALQRSAGHGGPWECFSGLRAPSRSWR